MPQSSTPGVELTGLAQSENYIVNIVTVDHCLRQTPPPPTPFKFRLDDNQPPSAPILGTPTTDGHDVFLSWTPSTDNVAVDDYKVYPGTTLVGRTPGTTFEDSNLPDATTFNYFIVATDTAGNPSSHSTVISATTKDMTPPTAPGGFTGRPNVGSTFTLTWNAASDNVKVTGYRVTRTGTGTAMTTNVTGTSYIDRNVPAGSYTWSVQAYDAAGLLSSPRTCTGISNGTPKATAASQLRVIKSKGVLAVKVGRKSGQRVVLVFKLKQPFARAVLHLHVISGKAKVRVSLPAGSGRNTPGKRLGQKTSKKGVLKIKIGPMKAQTLRLVITAQGGLVTIAGPGGADAPTIMNAS